MSERLKLSALVAARAGIPKSDGVPGVIRHSLNAPAAEGIIATHDAADVLIEIASAALEAVAMNRDTRVFREAMRDLRAACDKVEP